MAEGQIRFTDGAGYEKMMGVWSRLVGDAFLDWIAPAPGQKWLDVGCGNGAFTELIVRRCAPAAVEGIDPAEAQLGFARQRQLGSVASFRQGDAMALPFSAADFDVAVSALVLFFMPDPANGVLEMARLVRPGGMVASYVWDLLGGGFPYEATEAEMRALGTPAVRPPHPEAAERDELRRLWNAAGLEQVEVREIVVERRFDDFEDYWATAMLTPGIMATTASMTADDLARLKERVRAKARPRADGSIVQTGRAHAVKGIVAG